MEKYLETHSRDWCVDTIVLGLFVVSNYNAATKYLVYEETSHVFFYDFSEKLICNSMDSSPTRPTTSTTRPTISKNGKDWKSASSVPFITRPTEHIFQKRKKILLQYGRVTTFHKQGRCRICQMKTTWMFSICNIEYPDDNHWHCNVKSVS